MTRRAIPIGRRLLVSRERVTNPPKKRWRPMYPIRLVKIVTWRDPKTGHKTSPPTRKKRYRPGTYPRREEMVAQVDARNRIVRQIELTTRRQVIRTSIANEPGSVDMPFYYGTGRLRHVKHLGESGLIDPALARTGVYRHLRGAKTITVFVRSRNAQGELVKAKKQFITYGIKNVRAMLVRGVIDALRLKGYRTQYNLNLVDWSLVKPLHYKSGGRLNTKSEVRKFRPVHDTEIVITIDR